MDQEQLKKIQAYEATGLTPEQIWEVDQLYRLKCEEVVRLRAKLKPRQLENQEDEKREYGTRMEKPEECGAWRCRDFECMSKSAEAFSCKTMTCSGCYFGATCVNCMHVEFCDYWKSNIKMQAEAKDLKTSWRTSLLQCFNRGIERGI